MLLYLKISSSKMAIYFWSGCHLEKVHKTTDKTRVITSSFSKTSVFTRPRVNTNTAFLKTSVFTRLHVNTKTAFSKTSTLESVFENLRFRMPKTPFTCGGNAKTEKKTSVFKNIRIRVDGALSLQKSIDMHRNRI